LRLLSIFVAVVLVALALAWMSGILHSRVPPGVVEAQRATAAGRTVVLAELVPTPEEVETMGTVEPRRKAYVASQILAVIQQVNVTANEHVDKDDVLVVLDDREMEAQLREAEAAETGARADLDVRAADFKRYQQMFRENAVTKEEYDRIEGAYKGAQSQLDRLGEQVKRVRVMLEHTRIKAQTAGIVGERFVDPGDLAVPSKTLLTLHDPSQRDLHAIVPESLSAVVKVNMEVPVRVEAANYECRGVVREIVKQAQQPSRAFLVKVELPKEAADVLYVGMFGRLSIPTGTTQRILVPAAAVHHVGQVDLVEVVHEDGTLDRRFVRTGRTYEKKVEILSGLTAGERVALPR
jgi:RND family efflux transporter MFP subunit